MPSLRHQYIDRGWNCLYFLTLRQATAVSQGKGFTANCYIAFATDLSASILMNICIGKSIVTFTQLLSEPIVSRLFLWRQTMVAVLLVVTPAPSCDTTAVLSFSFFVRRDAPPECLVSSQPPQTPILQGLHK